jgi:hypothetical protein
MMFDENLAEELFVQAQKENSEKWRSDPRWKNIQGITKEELKRGSARIHKLNFPPWDKRSEGEKSGGSGGALVGFGKYSEKTVEWVKEHDFRYFSWLLENVPRFAAKVRELGLA